MIDDGNLDRSSFDLFSSWMVTPERHVWLTPHVSCWFQRRRSLESFSAFSVFKQLWGLARLTYLYLHGGGADMSTRPGTLCEDNVSIYQANIVRCTFVATIYVPRSGVYFALTNRMVPFVLVRQYESSRPVGQKPGGKNRNQG